MTTLLIIILSVLSGCEASFRVAGCRGGSVKFNCSSVKLHKSASTDGSGLHRVVANKTTLRYRDRISLHGNAKPGPLVATIRDLQLDDAGTYHCDSAAQQKVQLEVEEEGQTCKGPIKVSSRRGGDVKLTCAYPHHLLNATWSVCKQHGFECKEVKLSRLSKISSFPSAATLTLLFRSVTVQDAGSYWCRVQTLAGHHGYTALTQKIQLHVFVTDHQREFSRPLLPGALLSYWCHYGNNAGEKSICKGDELFSCEVVLTSTQPNKGRFSMGEQYKGRITVNITDLRAEDRGTYWCSTTAADSTTIHNKLILAEVADEAVAEGSKEPLVVIIIVCGALILLLLLLLLVVSPVVSRRCLLSNSPGTGTAAGGRCVDVGDVEFGHLQVQEIEDVRIYEEIPLHPQRPDPVTAITSIYVTADFSTNPSDYMNYSTVTYTKTADGPSVKPRNSTCDYSCAQTTPSGSCPSNIPDEPLYLDVTKLQDG